MYLINEDRETFRLSMRWGDTCKYRVFSDLIRKDKIYFKYNLPLVPCDKVVIKRHTREWGSKLRFNYFLID